MFAPNGSACVKCGFFAHQGVCKNKSCVVGLGNLEAIQEEREENLRVLQNLRDLFWGVVPQMWPTHETMPHDHQDVQDQTRDGYREIWAPRSSLNHYLEVQVFAPMRSEPDPDRKALLAWQAFNGQDWASHEVPAHKVLHHIRDHQDQEEKLFFLTVEARTKPAHWNERDKF